MFNGRFDHAIDDKGRVSIPIRFREILQRDGHEILYITNWISEKDHCLALYPPNEWERLIGKIRQRSSFNREMELFQSFYIGGAHEVQVDKQGRILIPPRLREYARLQRDVTFSAMIDHFELWDTQALEKHLKAVETSVRNPKFLDKLNL